MLKCIIFNSEYFNILLESAKGKKVKIPLLLEERKVRKNSEMAATLPKKNERDDVFNNFKLGYLSSLIE